MESKLHSLSKVFSERLFRIPDYQRGYAWGQEQLEDFWNDLMQLESPSNHYTGVLTLEKVPEVIYKNWRDDEWLIDKRSYEPFYVVDGQQRLTTCIILIKALVAELDTRGKLNTIKKADIESKYLYESNDDNEVVKSYIFGYEDNNPSYEFLKTRILGNYSPTAIPLQETIYTNNLQSALDFFQKRIKPLKHAQREDVFKKITQHLHFNIFSISDDVETCVAFETMNNRGKPLTTLELLKNRLVFLSIKFTKKTPSDRAALRRLINECWRTVYYNLGRNKSHPLDDELFLRCHFFTYYSNFKNHPPQYEAAVGYAFRSMHPYHEGELSYSAVLLKHHFVPSSIVSRSRTHKAIVTFTDVQDYSISLQMASDAWFHIHNPLSTDVHPDLSVWLDKIDRMNMLAVRVLLLQVWHRLDSAPGEALKLLKSLERYVFLARYTVGHRMLTRRSDPFDLLLEQAYQFGRGKPFDQLSKDIDVAASDIIKNPDFANILDRTFKDHKDGFYTWEGIRYFLFEYNLHLQELSKTNRVKIHWAEFNEDRRDFITVEHVLPRTPTDPYWQRLYSKYSATELKALQHSLGNLVPLSKPKNSSLQNISFPDKIRMPGKASVGFQFGSYAENEIAHMSDWTAEAILERGLKLLRFLEERWSIPLGDDIYKKRLLNLPFMP